MKSKIYTYENDAIKVTWDKNRCIHAAKCVENLNSVFNTDQKPWIQPENASAEDVTDTVELCPTGALQYEMITGERTEKPASQNRITIAEDGPLYISGEIEVQNPDGETILTDTRFAFCRCGASGNKPACDNTHLEEEWTGDAKADSSNMNRVDSESHGKLLIKLMKDGPAIVEGTYVLDSPESGSVTSDKGIALCRCGGSSKKPFCDGTHFHIGFKDD